LFGAARSCQIAPSLVWLACAIASVDHFVRCGTMPAPPMVRTRLGKECSVSMPAPVIFVVAVLLLSWDRGELSVPLAIPLTRLTHRELVRSAPNRRPPPGRDGLGDIF
jgi:hypothetical protein